MSAVYEEKDKAIVDLLSVIEDLVTSIQKYNERKYKKQFMQIYKDSLHNDTIFRNKQITK